MTARPGPSLQVHPSLELGDGSTVVVESRRGAARFEVEVTSDIRPDTVFAPFHWDGDGAANLLTTDALDPISKMPELKVCAVRLQPAEPYPEGRWAANDE